MINKARLWMFIAAGIGLLDASYLSWSKLANQQVICGEYKGCETVNSSPYAEINGIPIALLGAGAFLAILGLLYLEKQNDYWAQNGILGVFVISLAGTLYSAYLTYIEIAVLRAVCFYCVISAVAITTLLVLAVIRLTNPQAEAKLTSDWESL
jgi:uncharacterized membrane protein